MDKEAMRAEFEKWWFGEDTSCHPQNTFSGADSGTEHWVYEGWLRGAAAERERIAKAVEKSCCYTIAPFMEDYEF